MGEEVIQGRVLLYSMSREAMERMVRRLSAFKEWSIWGLGGCSF